MIKTIELFFRSWEIKFEDGKYRASAHFYAKEWSMNDPNTYEYVREEFDNLPAAEMWCDEMAQQ